MKTNKMNARLSNVSSDDLSRAKRLANEGNSARAITFETSLTLKEVNAVFALLEIEKRDDAKCGVEVESNVQKVETIKRGEFVRRKADAVKTYQRGEYDKTTKTFSLVDCDDHCREIFVKRGTNLFVGFTY